jgi:Domain of unknown function (DUF4390)
VLLTRWRRPLLGGFAALLCLAAAPCVSADDAGRFEIRNAFVELVDGAWQLHVRLDLALSKAAQQAFDEGVPLELALEAEATIPVRFLPNDVAVARERRWKLAHDAIADRYVVTDVDSGEQVSHATQEEALASLSRISGMPFAGVDQLAADRRFNMRVRATVEIGELPAAVKFLLFWKSWSRSTDWYAWKVRPQ